MTAGKEGGRGQGIYDQKTRSREGVEQRRNQGNREERRGKHTKRNITLNILCLITDHCWIIPSDVFEFFACIKKLWNISMR